jgi:Serine aminopeptidase, S33
MTEAATEVCRFVDPHSGGTESVGYIDVAGSRVYTVMHAAPKPAAAVLLCGPIGAERERAYRTLVDLAREIATAGFVAMRLDYRGIGESTGRFEELTLSDWHADVVACAEHLAEQVPGLPLALWGVRAGALLVSESFRDGLGDAAMFCAPTSGREMLQDILRRNFVAEALTGRTARPTTREELVQSLEHGAAVNVDGYPWSGRLWADAARHAMVFPPASETRPWRLVEYRRATRSAPIAEVTAQIDEHREIEAGERFWEGSMAQVPRPSTLPERTVAWLRTLANRAGER